MSAKRTRVKDGDTLPVQDDSRPIEASSDRFMLNNCRECGRYKWVYHVDLRDGNGLGYVCGRCRREAIR